MTTPAPRNGRPVPPRPATPPTVPHLPRARGPQPPATRSPKYNIEKINLVPDISGMVPPLSFNYTRTTVVGSSSAPAKGNPGSDFLSNEDMRAYCENGRKKARSRATETAMDIDMMEARLKSIPDVTGSMTGARARAKRVVRWGRRIAQAEKLIAKWYAALYGAFEREYEAELVKIGRGRYQQPKPVSSAFRWR